MAAILVTRVQAGHIVGIVAQVVFLLIVGFLLYGSLVYHVTRLGHLERLCGHVRASRPQIDAVFRETTPPLVTVLVPSYLEEPKIVWRTLLCAALQEYPIRRVVLLIDDPPVPSDRTAMERLTEARALPGKVQDLLEEPLRACAAARDAFERRQSSGARSLEGESRVAAHLCRIIAGWFQRQAQAYDADDHADRHFVDLTFRRAARALREQAETVRSRLMTREELAGLYARLVARFDVEISAFERKRYDNLSHAPNKAMNLNSYLSLLDGRFDEVQRDGVLRLERTARTDADLVVPASDFVLILDADSALTSDYALRLVHLMREPGNERIAVAQTPYKAFPGAPGWLERVAGATTDIQYLNHQGFTRFGATFWVGANAVVRTAALRDIASATVERGHAITCFIRDRTVIEDTESTVDLVAKGWRLHNYPEPMAYSETPPDFGCLLVQRRRWANGGLIILPKLLRHLVRQRPTPQWALQSLTMTHYLVSLATVNVGLLLMLGFSFETSMRTSWLPVAAAPYFVLYARDLSLLGYRLSDVLRVYALNLVLLPVNLVGVASSLRQAITGRKVAFARTPKVRGRTGVAPFYVVAQLALLVLWQFGIVRDVITGRPVHGLLTALNVVFLVYGLVVFVGVREAIADVRAELVRRRAF